MKADEPDAVVYLFDTDSLAGQAGTEIDFLAVQAKATAVGDHDSLVVKWVIGDRHPLGPVLSYSVSKE